jgi:putative GTP pyrophosphokinase
MGHEEIRALYKERFENVLKKLAECLENDLRAAMGTTPRIDRISLRAKSIDRFVTKSMKIENNKLKYSDPLNEIQDQIGARITCFYLSDIARIGKDVIKYYKPIEERMLIPESENEFGYVGKHFILHIPTDCRTPMLEKFDESLIPKFFELQIKTLFQHAWSEASHDLAYKPDVKLTRDQKRKVAFTAAQAWGADMIFEELFKQLSLQ